MNSKQAIDRIMKVLGLVPQKFYEAKTEQGIAVKIDGDLEVGAPIYVATEEGLIPAPPGMHKLDDGSEIEVDEDGKVSKIKMGDMEMEKTEDEKIEDKKEEESIKDETMSQVELEFGDVKLKDGKIIRVGGEEPAAGLHVRMVSYDGTLTAIADGEYETESGKVISIVGGAIQGVQSISDDKKRSEGFVIAESADGAMIESPTFDVGEDAYIVKEDGSKDKAPDGEHQVELKDSEGNEVKIRIQTKDGKITQRENVEQESEEMSAEQIAEIFSLALKKLENKIDAIAEKQTKLEGSFKKFSKEPAGEKVYNQKTITETFSQTDRVDQFKRLREAMSHKN